MGLLEHQLEKGHPPALSTRVMIKQRLKQPLPLLFALLLTAILVSALYKVHNDAGVTSLNVPFNWPVKEPAGDGYNELGDGPSLPLPVEDENLPGDGTDTNFEADFGLPEDKDEDDVNLPPPKNADDNDDSPLGFNMDEDDEYDSEYTPEYREVFSHSTRDRRFMHIFASGINMINPNLIPHPTMYDMWIIIARHERSHEIHSAEEMVVCTAGFFEDVLVCEGPPTVLPVTPSIAGQCEGELSDVNLHYGPRDARVFYGPDAPYIIYGSQSQYTCFGVWLQDARILLDAFHMDSALAKVFREATEVRRPGRWKAIEKNFFIFWDNEGKMYAHHDIWPQRAFAQLDIDGTVGEDLAPAAASRDQVCAAKYMPPVAPQEEWLQQATNSLQITLCKRADPGCVPSDSNTFNMHIFHIKSKYDGHAVYEPFVILFERTAPFAIHAISQQPLWIHGRESLTVDSLSVQFEGKTESDIPEGHTERFYMTSMSWKSHGQKYHGHIDDVLFLAFGIEDSRAGALDVLASDILQDLAFC